MMNWKEEIISRVKKELKNAGIWEKTLKKLNEGKNSIHLAIFSEPFLSFVFDGRKTIESRFSVNNVSPFNRVTKGDIIVAKKSGGSVIGVFLADEVFFFNNLNEKRLNQIKNKYGTAICSDADPNFWQNRSEKNYATLVKISEYKILTPFNIQKRDRRGWVTLKDRKTQMEIPLL